MVESNQPAFFRLSVCDLSLSDLSGSTPEITLQHLEIGLQSPNVSDQLAVVGSVVSSLEKYNFLWFIQKVFAKLAEAYCVGNNLLRREIVQTFKLCVEHTYQIRNGHQIGEILVNVAYCNDYVARALTLRLFGLLAHQLYEVQSIQIFINSALSSKNCDELTAAIYAASQFSRYTIEFADSVYDKIVHLLHSDEIPRAVKFASMYILQHVNVGENRHKRLMYDLEAVLCIHIADYRFAERLLRAVVKMGTKNGAFGKYIPFIILRIVTGDSGRRIKETALEYLAEFALKCPVNFGTKGLLIFQKMFSKRSSGEPFQLRNLLRAFLYAAGGACIAPLNTEQKLDVVFFCNELIDSDAFESCAAGVAAYFNLITYTKDILLKELLLKSMILNFSKAVVKFNTCEPDENCCIEVFYYFVNAIFNYWILSDKKNAFLLKFLVSTIPATKAHRFVVLNVLRKMSSLCFETMKKISSLCDIKWLEEPFELGLVYFFAPPLCETSADTASVNKLKLTAWNKYMIGLTAMNTGHFKLAADMFEIICNYKIENDQHYKWLQLLIKICQNEAALMRMNCDNNDMELSSTLIAAASCYQTVISFLQDYCEAKGSSSFSVCWCMCRMVYLQALHNISNACKYLDYSIQLDKTGNIEQCIINFTKKMLPSYSKLNLVMKNLNSIKMKCFRIDADSLFSIDTFYNSVWILFLLLSLLLKKQTRDLEWQKLEKASTERSLTVSIFMKLIAKLKILKKHYTSDNIQKAEMFKEILFKTKWPSFMFPKCFFFVTRKQHLTLNIPADMSSPHCAKCISSDQMFTVHLEGQFNEGINKKLYACANKVLIIVTAATPVDIITLTDDESARNDSRHKILTSEDIIYSREVAVLDGCFSTYLVFNAPPLEIIPMKSNGAGILSVSVHLLDGDSVFKLDVGDANRIYYKFVDEIS
ncbi:Integrator complex subunit 7 [Trichinella pseudospiralis]|uniref:Integrator complex subunit 7 n=1 Tax=Trichinella pseudospiralis TaxID=6337 RepID=A0A0V1H757_TRIPS|nr:Integrator complex subunit 7 [Trichinella pseudospiralis]KRZ39200.1 Integrator complex subunit 7 [Trichinella pseudospiralis]